MIEGKSILLILAIFVGIPAFIETWYMDIHAWVTDFDMYRGVIVGIVGIVAVSGLTFRIIVKATSEAYDLWQKIKPKKHTKNINKST